MNGAELLAWLCSLDPEQRDAAVEEYLGIRTKEDHGPPGEHLVGYHASGVGAILRALVRVPVVPEDMVVDLGSGLGKVVLLARICTGASARGVERDAALVRRAREAAVRLHADVEFTESDARDADLDDGTVFFLYLPFTGPVLEAVLARLRSVAQRRSIVVCALGFDLGRMAPWLVARPSDDFWLTLYDSALPFVPPRPSNLSSPLGADASVIGWDAFPSSIPA